MKKKMPISAMIALMGAIFLVTGLITMRSGAASKSGYVKLTAQVHSIRLEDGLNQVSPIVDFTVDGETFHQSCKPVSAKKVQASPGDTVTVYARRGKALGLTTWSVLWDQGEDTVSRSVRMYMIAGGIFAVIGIVLLGAAFALRRI